MSRSGSRSRSRSRGRSAERTETSTKVYVSNLPPDVTEEDIRAKFEEYGRVEKVEIKRKAEDIVFAFIEFSAVKQASKAIDGMNRNDFQGRSLKVEFAKGKSNRYEQRGSFRGRGGYGYDRGDRGGYRGSRPEGGRFGDNFGDRGDRPPRGEAKCFNCQGTGHFIKDCPKPAKQGGYRPRGGDRDRDRDFGGRDRDRDRDYRGRDRDDDRERDRRRRSRSGSSDGGDRRRRSDRNDY